MWLVVNEEFHDDPLTQFVAPPRPYAGNRDVFVFIDAGERALVKVALTGYAEEHVRRFFEAPEPGGAAKALAALFEKHQPKTIALASSIELNTATPVPEWNGCKGFVM